MMNLLNANIVIRPIVHDTSQHLLHMKENSHPNAEIGCMEQGPLHFTALSGKLIKKLVPARCTHTYRNPRTKPGRFVTGRSTTCSYFNGHIGPSTHLRTQTRSYTQRDQIDRE